MKLIIVNGRLKNRISLGQGRYYWNEFGRCVPKEYIEEDVLDELRVKLKLKYWDIREYLKELLFNQRTPRYEYPPKGVKWILTKKTLFFNYYEAKSGSTVYYERTTKFRKPI